MRLLPALVCTCLLATSCVSINVTVGNPENANANGNGNTNIITNKNTNDITKVVNANVSTTPTTDDDVVAGGREASFTVEVPENWTGRTVTDNPLLAITYYGPKGVSDSEYKYSITTLYGQEGKRQDAMIKEDMSMSGAPFTDWKSTVEDAEVNGTLATMQVTTSPVKKDWLLRKVYVKGARDVYVLSNGGTDDPEFESFVQSFRWQ